MFTAVFLTRLAASDHRSTVKLSMDKWGSCTITIILMLLPGKRYQDVYTMLRAFNGYHVLTHCDVLSLSQLCALASLLIPPYQELRMALHSPIQLCLVLTRRSAFGAERRMSIHLVRCKVFSGETTTTLVCGSGDIATTLAKMCTLRALPAKEMSTLLLGSEFFTSTEYSLLMLESTCAQPTITSFS